MSEPAPEPPTKRAKPEGTSAVSEAVAEAEVPKLQYASSCAIPDSWMGLKLLKKSAYNHDSKIYDFALPDGFETLALPTCGCLLVMAPGKSRDGSDAIRPYTPISPSDMKGKFQLLIKRYQEGCVSSYIDEAAIGAEINFKHITFNVKKQYPFGVKTLTMLCMGTGIAPMYQALHKLLTTEGDETQIVLIYGNKTPADILLKDELDEFAKANSRFKLVNVVGQSADDMPMGWDGETGWIDEAKVKKYAFPATADTNVFICGLPAMYESFCGARGEPGLKEGTIMHNLGYSAEQITKF